MVERIGRQEIYCSCTDALHIVAPCIDMELLDFTSCRHLLACGMALGSTLPSPLLQLKIILQSVWLSSVLPRLFRTRGHGWLPSNSGKQPKQPVGYAPAGWISPSSQARLRRRFKLSTFQCVTRQGWPHSGLGCQPTVKNNLCPQRPSGQHQAVASRGGSLTQGL